MNVLVAEDDYRVAEIHCQYLQKFKEIHHIERTANAKETLQKLKEHKFDILLLDVYLPDELGTNMIEAFKKENAFHTNHPCYCGNRYGNIKESILFRSC